MTSLYERIHGWLDEHGSSDFDNVVDEINHMRNDELLLHISMHLEDMLQELSK